MKRSIIILLSIFSIALFAGDVKSNANVRDDFAAFDNAASGSLVEDSLALTALYTSTDGANWVKNDNWLIGPVESWYGIKLNNGRVTNILFTNNNLSGKIPPEIGNLTELTNLRITNNNLSDSIPSEIGNLTKLDYLTLGNNQLTGPIPREIGNLTNLNNLHLHDNQLSGEIPSEIGYLTNLVRLELFDNQFTGSIPPEIGNLINLESFLTLHDNKLTGAIPPEIGNLVNLAELWLQDNQLTGSIPPEIGDLASLRRLFLASNRLTGGIPIETGSLTNLTQLYLQENNLSGPIPPEIGNLINLTHVWLHSNQFTGSVPDEITNLSQLEYLIVHTNQIDRLPDLSSLIRLEQLYAADNQLTFEDIEPNINVPGSIFDYSPQDSIGISIDTVVMIGADLTFSISVGGSANKYRWRRDGIEITGAADSVLILNSVKEADDGNYICEVTNTLAPGLTIYSKPINVILDGVTNIDEDNVNVPYEFLLAQNYPNPFNPTTTIRFQIPHAGHLSIKIYNSIGQEVKTLVSRHHSAGNHEVMWDGTDNHGSLVSSGIYLYRLEAGTRYVQTKKMIYIK